MPEGFEEYTIEEIIDSQQCGCGYGPEHNKWITSAELNDCEALDHWYQNGGDGLDTW